MPTKKRVSESKAAEEETAPRESVDDYLLPRTMIARLAKGVLPPNTQIQKDAMSAILKSTTVFVNYLANNANDRAVLGNHKTIKPEDVIEALRDMEFEHFVPRVAAEHTRYVEIQNTKRNDYRHRVKGTGAQGGEEDSAVAREETETDDGGSGAVSTERVAKKRRVVSTNRAIKAAAGGEDADMGSIAEEEDTGAEDLDQANGEDDDEAADEDEDEEGESEEEDDDDDDDDNAASEHEDVQAVPDLDKIAAPTTESDGDSEDDDY